jgi:hypothetical protein
MPTTRAKPREMVSQNPVAKPKSHIPRRLIRPYRQKPSGRLAREKQSTFSISHATHWTRGQSNGKQHVRAEMTPRNIVGVVAIVCGSICGILACLANVEMISKVNNKLPDAEKFADLFWYPSKRRKLHRKYRTFYPDGRLLIQVHILTAVIFMCFFVTAWSFGFFAK